MPSEVKKLGVFPLANIVLGVKTSKTVAMKETQTNGTYRNLGGININESWANELVCASATGTDTTYTLSHNPGTLLLVFINGILQRENIDYTVIGNNLTFTSVIGHGKNIMAVYNY